ncbi:hypothetical protein GCM10009827_107140 [Dactylosporangium maewongense]|uniref:Uncharacterized protein n=1 Tax=Dactylosporangium maewongense TaxID=634393 RepID=A0ABN2D2X0_9ACTN
MPVAHSGVQMATGTPVVGRHLLDPNRLYGVARGHSEALRQAQVHGLRCLTTLGFALPDSARQWAQRPPATPCRTVERATRPVHDEWGIMQDGRPFFVAGYTSGGALYGWFRIPAASFACARRPTIRWLIVTLRCRFGVVACI